MLSHMEADRTRLKNIEARIQDLVCSISALRNEQALVQNRLDSYMYPVLTLPNEIVSEIFIHFLPTYPLPPPLTGIYSPTCLTQICRTWRKVALSTPALWRAIDLTDGRIPHERLEQLSDICLRRSGCCPLSLKLDGNTSPEMLPAVVAQRARWEHLTIQIRQSALLMIAMDGPLPLLHHLDLTVTEVTFPMFALHDHQVPRLRSVVLDRYSMSGVSLPWGQLTSLKLINVYPQQCAPILQQTANLVHCDLHLWINNTFVPGPDIELPYLDSLILTISFPGSEEMEGFLHSFIAPSLHSLQVSERFLGSNPIASLRTFISKSHCSLREVCILDASVGSVPKEAYRKAFPSISEIIC
ncbi:hypothetical protein K438DRAFT_56170 [Mycena galopus ATCC 62051]|nr:hypothetical protein K438DRAFT_56170 [Mycena galopus ATCC 62051]